MSQQQLLAMKEKETRLLQLTSRLMSSNENAEAMAKQSSGITQEVAGLANEIVTSVGRGPTTLGQLPDSSTQATLSQIGNVATQINSSHTVEDIYRRMYKTVAGTMGLSSPQGTTGQDAFGGTNLVPTEQQFLAGGSSRLSHHFGNEVPEQRRTITGTGVHDIISRPSRNPAHERLYQTPTKNVNQRRSTTAAGKGLQVIA